MKLKTLRFQVGKEVDFKRRLNNNQNLFTQMKTILVPTDFSELANAALQAAGNIAKKTLDEIKELDKRIDYTKLVCVHTNGKIFHLEAFILVIYHWNK